MQRQCGGDRGNFLVACSGVRGDWDESPDDNRHQRHRCDQDRQEHEDSSHADKHERKPLIDQSRLHQDPGGVSRAGDYTESNAAT